MNPADPRWKTAALNRWQTLMDDASHKFDRAKELAEDGAQNLDFALGDVRNEMVALKKAGQADSREYAMLTAMEEKISAQLRYYSKTKVTEHLSNLWFALGSQPWDKYK